MDGLEFAATRGVYGLCQSRGDDSFCNSAGNVERCDHAAAGGENCCTILGGATLTLEFGDKFPWSASDRLHKAPQGHREP